MRVSLLGQVGSLNLWDRKVGLGRMILPFGCFFSKRAEILLLGAQVESC